MHGLRVVFPREAKDFRLAHGHGSIGLLLADPEIFEKAHGLTRLAPSRGAERGKDIPRQREEPL